MAHGKRWNVEITWLDDNENEAVTSYNSWEKHDEVVNAVADAVAKFCKATYHPTIIGTYVEMHCLTCGYESEKDPHFARTYVCKCDRGLAEEMNKVQE